MTTNPMALTLEALLDAMVKAIDIIAGEAVMHADTRDQLWILRKQVCRIHAKFVDAHGSLSQQPTVAWETFYCEACGKRLAEVIKRPRSAKPAIALCMSCFVNPKC